MFFLKALYTVVLPISTTCFLAVPGLGSYSTVLISHFGLDYGGSWASPMESAAYSGAGCPFDTMEPSVETHRGSLVEPFYKPCHPKSSLNLGRYRMYEFGIDKFHFSSWSTVLHATSYK